MTGHAQYNTVHFKWLVEIGIAQFTPNLSKAVAFINKPIAMYALTDLLTDNGKT